MQEKMQMNFEENGSRSGLFRKAGLATLAFFCAKGIFWLGAGYFFYWIR